MLLLAVHWPDLFFAPTRACIHMYVHTPPTMLHKIYPFFQIEEQNSKSSVYFIILKIKGMKAVIFIQCTYVAYILNS